MNDTTEESNELFADLSRIQSWFIEIDKTIENQDTLDATFMEKYNHKAGEMIKLMKDNCEILNLYPDTCHDEGFLYKEFHDMMRILHHMNIVIGVKAIGFQFGVWQRAIGQGQYRVAIQYDALWRRAG